jgi:hypothetical protein
VALGTFHDSCRDGPEINIFQAKDVSTARANMNALPLGMLDRIGGWWIHEVGAFGLKRETVERASACLKGHQVYTADCWSFDTTHGWSESTE